MINEKQLLEKFQVEELEKRYEFSWVDSVRVGVSSNTTGAGVSVVIPIK